jgi:xanthine dehydrogenase molybdenum-binding subunit
MITNEMAEKLGIDPVDYKTKFGMQAGDTVLMSQQKLAGGSAPKLVQKLALEVGWKDKWKGWGIPSEINGSKRRGVGICIAQHECGWVVANQLVGRSCVLTKVNLDGKADISCNNIEVGSGVDTAMCMVTAEILGIDLNSVKKAAAGSTGAPNSTGSLASSGLGTNVYAAFKAAEDVRNKILNGASVLLKVNPKDLTLDLNHKCVYVTAVPDKKTSLYDVGILIGGGVLYGLGSSAPPPEAPDGLKDPLTGRSLAERGIFAAFAELDVDIETGKVDIVNAVTAFQSGMVLNPLIMSGQAIGGLVHGISQMLGEGVIYDEPSGTPLNSSICDYPVWGSADAHPDILHAFADVDPADAPLFPFKAKGAAEGIYAALWGAIPLAIHNATGVWMREMTCRPEKILKALGKADFPVTKGVI